MVGCAGLALVAAISVAGILPGLAEEAPLAPGFKSFGENTYQESIKGIFILLVLAVVLESGLAVIFNWRPFVENLVPRAVRPLIAFIGALILVRLFNLDVVTTLINAINGTTSYPPNISGQILTALVLAGGSAGVNSLLVSLGFRQVRTPETIIEKPPPTKAWIAVRALPGTAVGDLYVFAGPTPARAADGTINIPLIGIIKKRSRRNLLSYFVADRGRTPNYGGHTINPNQGTVVLVTGKDEAGNAVEELWGPYQLDAGATIDIDVKV
jgi:hypothetical protein